MSLSGDRSNATLGGNFSCGPTPGDRSLQWTATVILSLIIFAITVLLGVPGNGAVVWVTGIKMKRNIHTVFFLNLAVADLTYCITLPFVVAAMLGQYWCRHHLLWMFVLCEVTLNMSASIFLLTLISICRCLAVTRPIWFRQHLRLAWLRAACFVAWALAFLMCLPHLLSEQRKLYFGDKSFVVDDVTCVVFSFGIPVAIMAACYLLMGRKLHGYQSSKIRKHLGLIVTVVAAFIVCWLPNTVCRLLMVFSQHVPSEWLFMTLSLASFNSALNPLLYVFAGRDICQVFRRSLAASLRLALAEEGVTVGNRPSDAPSRNVGRATSPDEG